MIGLAASPGTAVEPNAPRSGPSAQSPADPVTLGTEAFRPGPVIGHHDDRAPLQPPYQYLIKLCPK